MTIRPIEKLASKDITTRSKLMFLAAANVSSMKCNCSGLFCRRGFAVHKNPVPAGRCNLWELSCARFDQAPFADWVRPPTTGQLASNLPVILLDSKCVP